MLPHGECTSILLVVAVIFWMPAAAASCTRGPVTSRSPGWTALIVRCGAPAGVDCALAAATPSAATMRTIADDLRMAHSSFDYWLVRTSICRLEREPFASERTPIMRPEAARDSLLPRICVYARSAVNRGAPQWPRRPNRSPAKTRRQRVGQRSFVKALFLDLQICTIDVSAYDMGPLQLVPDGKVERLANLALALTVTKAFLDALAETMHGSAQVNDVAQGLQISVPRYEMPDVERLNLLERADPVLDEPVLQRRNDAVDENVAGDEDFVVRQMDQQVTGGVGSTRNHKDHSYAVNQQFRSGSLGVGQPGGERLRSGERASDRLLHDREPLLAGFENRLAAHLGADQRGALERRVSQMVIAVVVCIDDVRHWLVGDLAHGRSDVPAHLGRASGVDKDDALVAYDDR